ncbi:MAG TPA: transketolase C-terminal domain-containing protein [Pseudonocardiaceae bacterium]|nr:transketolase C-terminal domain-containing protein [Pseudonocardiaceae bacterium]
MRKLSYSKALNLALAHELAADPTVCVFGEDIVAGMAGLTLGLHKRFGADRIVDTPLSEQGFAGMAIGAALAGRRPVIEFQIPSLLFLVFEQIANQAHKLSLMTGGQLAVPVTYIVPASGSRAGWAGQHSDHPYSLFAHVGVKTLVPAMPSDAYGLLRSAIQDPDPTVIFAPALAMDLREAVEIAELAPVPIGSARVRREGSDVTVVALGHLVWDALSVADELAGEVSVEVFDPRTVYPFDWAALAASVTKTGRLVVIDDSNRMCGFAAEILAGAAESLPLLAQPQRVTRPDGAVLPFARQLDQAVQPQRAQLIEAIRTVMK